MYVSQDHAQVVGLFTLLKLTPLKGLRKYVALALPSKYQVRLVNNV